MNSQSQTTANIPAIKTLVVMAEITAQSEKVWEKSFSDSDLQCSMAVGGSQKGGLSAEEATKKAIKLSLYLALATVVYMGISLTQLNKVECFAWYTPFASVVRTPIQNMYCSALIKYQKTINDIITQGLNAVDIPQFLIASSAATGFVKFSYQHVYRVARACNKGIDELVGFIYNGNTSKEAVAAVRGIGEQLLNKLEKEAEAAKTQNAAVAAKKVAETPDDEEDYDDEEQEGGGKKKKIAKKVPAKKAPTKPKKPTVSKAKAPTKPKTKKN